MNVRCHDCGLPTRGENLILAARRDGWSRSPAVFDTDLSGLTVAVVQAQLKIRLCPFCMLMRCFADCAKRQLKRDEETYGNAA